MTIRATAIAACLGGLALVASACGSETDCGVGTVEVDGTCMPAEDACTGGSVYDPETGLCEGVTCADGTSLEGDECVPDGTVVCGDGTSYDADTGTCEPDIGECAEGTVLIDGTCVPYDDSLTADIEELPEPNDVPDANAGEFEIPAAGDPAVTIHGCIDPVDVDDDGVADIDSDAYYFVADGPTLLEVTVDGLGGLSGGFIAIPGDDELVANDWLRIGVTLTGDVAQRQLYLPKAGVYALQISDGRSLFLGEPAGGPDQCYFASVSQVEIPAPTPLADGLAEGELGNDVHFFSYDPAEGDFLFSAATIDSGSASVGLVQELNGSFVSSSPYADPAELVIGGLTDADEVVFVVDPEVNYALDVVPFSLTVDAPVVGEAPADGTTQVTHDEGFYSWLYFDVEAGDVVHAVADVNAGADTFELLVADADGFVVGSLCNGCTAVDEWIHFTEAGRYYLVVYNIDGEDGTAYDLAMSRIAVTPEPLTVGTVLDDESLSSELTNWYTLDLASETWIEIVGDSTNLDGDLDFTWYDRAETGVIGDSLEGLYEGVLSGADDRIGRIVEGMDPSTLLVAVTDTGDAVAGTTFDFGVDMQLYTDLGTVDENTLPDETGTSLAPGESNLYFLRAAPGSTVTITADPIGLEDLAITRLDAEEGEIALTNEEISAGAEVYEASVGDSGWVAFEVSEWAGLGGAYDLSFGYAPPPYAVTASGLTYASVCPDDGGAGDVHALSGADNGLSSTPLDLSGLSSPFELFGQAATELTVSSNGWLTTETGYAGGSGGSPQELPDADAPNAVVAPYWLDLDLVEVCTLVNADEAVVQWTGVQWFTSTAVEFQAVLHADGSIDFVYGPNHNDGAATIGVENAAGDEAVIVSNDAAGGSAPSTSWTFTPSM